MADSKELPSSPVDEDSDNDDLFASATTRADEEEEPFEKIDLQPEEIVSPDSGCESIVAPYAAAKEDELEKFIPPSELQDSASSSHSEKTKSSSPPSAEFYPVPDDSAENQSGKTSASGNQESRSNGHFDAEMEEDSGNVIEILVSDPKKIGDGMNAYVVYKVTTRTNFKFFRSCEMNVTRRFSDFLGLHEKLVEMYQSRGKIIPQAPEKSVIGMTKVKMTKDETGSMDFVEKRRASLERFLNRIAKHHDLRADKSFIDFLELDGELPKSSSTSALSGAGLARLFGKVGESINKMTFTMSEPDPWFEDKQEEIEVLDNELKQLHLSLETLVMHRKDLSMNVGQFAKSVAVLGSTEENMALSKALSSLAEIESKVEQLYADQADTDFFVLSELVKDYISLVQSVKDTLNERVKIYKIWKDAESMLAKKREAKVKLEQQNKMDRLDQADQEIAEWEQKVTRGQENFDEISTNIRKELSWFDRQKIKDFKATIINYLQTMMNNQQQLATYWESFIPEAKLIA